MIGLQNAAAMLGGQVPLALAMGIQDRSLRAKLAAERGVSDTDLALAADALDARAARLIAHAVKLRTLAGAGQ